MSWKPRLEQPSVKSAERVLIGGKAKVIGKLYK